MAAPRPPLMPVDQAQAHLFAAGPRVGAETVALRDAANRWAAEDVRAVRTQPFATLSAMDGYAIRFADLPGPWRVVGESAAGHPFAGTVEPGTAIRIFTGAALPAGADTVLVQEEAARDGEQLTLDGEGPAHLGRNTRPKGLDFTRDDVLIEAGEFLTPQRIALAATAGHATLQVARRIRVAIAATGDELVAPGTDAQDHLLPESNGALLTAMLAPLGVDLTDLGILPDRLDVLTDAFSAVDADLLVTTGGASVGDHDLVRPALEAAGGKVDFWRLALRPGKPMMAGRLNDAIVLGLPGNPVSAFVTATLFVKPLIAAMSGARDPLPRLSFGRLGMPLPANGERLDYVRARTIDGAIHSAEVQDSSMLRTLARSDCLVLREPHAPAAETGDTVTILPIA